MSILEELEALRRPAIEEEEERRRIKEKEEERRRIKEKEEERRRIKEKEEKERRAKKEELESILDLSNEELDSLYEYEIKHEVVAAHWQKDYRTCRRW